MSLKERLARKPPGYQFTIGRVLAISHTFSFSGRWSRTWLQPICSAATSLSTP